MSRTPPNSTPITTTSNASTPPRCGPSPTRSSPGSRNPPRSRCSGAMPTCAAMSCARSSSWRRKRPAAVGWLYSGLQVMKAGEVASAHQHSASALRFIIEGKGAYTVVDGHKMTLGENDFVLTPTGSWHEHGVDASGTDCIWQDGLDIPLVNALEANFYAVHPDLKQAVTYAVDDASMTWGAPGLQPAGSDWRKAYSPLLKYEWEPTYEALSKYANATDGSPFDGE